MPVARKAVMIYGAIGVTLLIPTIFATNLYLISFLFAFATFSYAGFTIMANVLPSDLYHSRIRVASVSGLSGTGAGIGTIVAFKFIGYLSDARRATGTHSFDPIVIVAGLVPISSELASRVVAGAQYTGPPARDCCGEFGGSSFSSSTVPSASIHHFCAAVAVV